MTTAKGQIKIGVLGCGVIGSGIAKAVKRDLKNMPCRLTALFDVDLQKALSLQKSLHSSGLVQKSYASFLEKCDLVVEAVSSQDTKALIKQAVVKKHFVLAMSVGALLNAKDLFILAKTKGVGIITPSGAIAGVDAITSAARAGIFSVTLTTRKPPSGFAGNPYLKRKGIDPSSIKKETVLFQGGVDQAVRFFPQNINVAATLALACKDKQKVKIRIVTSPKFTRNSHEVEVIGKSGRIMTRTENVVSPDNPKTSYLAVLSGIQALKNFCQGSRVGT